MPKRRRVARMASTLMLREESHRRATLLGIAALLLMSTSPVFGHHLPPVGQALFSGIDHVGALCLTALHLLLTPVHSTFHVVLFAGLAFAVFDRVRAWYRLTHALAPLAVTRPQLGDPFWRAARTVGFAPHRLAIVAGLPNPAFTAGLTSPRIYLARELGSRLNAAELQAVIAHEAAHVRRYDPLRLSVLRALACTLFWLPALRRLAEDMADEAEILADDEAAAIQPLALASAILALAKWPGVPLRATTGFYRHDLLERRVRRLAGEAVPAFSHVTRRSLIGAAVALSFVWATGVAMMHPLPVVSPETNASAHHCAHDRVSAWTHLFCLNAGSGAERECPHFEAMRHAGAQHRGVS